MGALKEFVMVLLKDLGLTAIGGFLGNLFSGKSKYSKEEIEEIKKHIYEEALKEAGRRSNERIEEELSGLRERHSDEIEGIEKNLEQLRIDNEEEKEEIKAEQKKQLEELKRRQDLELASLRDAQSAQLTNLEAELAEVRSKAEPVPPKDEKERKQMMIDAREKYGIDVEKKCNIAFVGSSGQGKSSLINCLRNIEEGHEEYAETGETECTMEMKMYNFTDKEKSHIALWDVPGGGTPKNVARSYFLDKCLHAFNLIVIVTGCRFTEIDLMIAEWALIFGVPFIFAKTKADVDIDNRFRKKNRGKVPKKDLKYAYKDEVVKNITENLAITCNDKRIFVLTTWMLQMNVERNDRDDYHLDEDAFRDYLFQFAQKAVAKK